jgi:putative Holliday junction resolvase
MPQSPARFAPDTIAEAGERGEEGVTVKERTRLLAIDPGKVRLGLAVSDPDHRLASPLATYTRRDLEQDVRFVQKMIEEHEIARLVIGLPVHLSGQEGEQARRARALGALLAQRTGLPCMFWDERFTTRAAESALWDAGLTHKRRKERRDQVAAQMLLQDYLEAGCPAAQTIAPLESDPKSPGESREPTAPPPAGG